MKFANVNNNCDFDTKKKATAGVVSSAKQQCLESFIVLDFKECELQEIE